MLDKDKVKKYLKDVRDNLYDIQCEYEKEENYNPQSIHIRQVLRGTLDIYSQIVADDRVFDEEYLKFNGLM